MKWHDREQATPWRNKTLLEGANSLADPEFLREIIPSELMDRYAPENLQFNVTPSMLRRSRPVVGNVGRLHAYLKKLHSRECTKVLFLGGSVTAGHNAGGPSNAFPRFFMDWLNARYPCRGGNHEMETTNAQNSQTHLIFWNSVTDLPRIDLVFVEFAVNDEFISGLPHALEDKGSEGDTREYANCWYTEVLFRRLLLLRKPDPLAIVTFDADYQGRIWADLPWQDPVKARKTLLHKNGEPLKAWLSTIYEIPLFSAVAWMLPLAGKRGRSWQFNRTHNIYSTSLWHADACCHPRRPGHLVLSIVLAYCFVQEERVMLSAQNNFPNLVDEVDRDLTLGQFPIMRDPVYLSPEEDNVYVQSTTPHDYYDFKDTTSKKKWQKIVVANDGWEWYADNKDEDKFGYIANDVNGGPHMAFSIIGRSMSIIDLSFVVSYENFGQALAWLDDSKTNSFAEICMNNETTKTDAIPKINVLSAIWSSKASVPKSHLLKSNITLGEHKFLHVCLTPRGPKQKGDQNKFKLLGLSVY